MDETQTTEQPLQETQPRPVTKVLGTEAPDPNLPRKMTEDEIKDVLTVIPELKGALESTTEFNRVAMVRTLREQLKEIVVTPLAFDDMKDEILRQFNEALIKPGSVVGVTAAEAIGKPITQMALNSFHKSGSAKNVTYGVDRVRELINASEKLKNTSCSIFFNNQNMSVDDVVLKVRPSITEIKVSDLVKGIPDIETATQIVEPWWYGPFRMLIRADFKANSVLRLKINVNMLYAYKINMEDICRTIEQNQQSVVCVYSPMDIGEIHVYPGEKEVAKPVAGTKGVVDKANASMVFLWNVVIPALDKLKITGISGIRQIYPVEAPVLQIIREEKRIPGVERGWYLMLNPVRIRLTGIRKEKLVHLTGICDIEVLKIRDGYIAVRTPDGESPMERINRLIKEDKAAEKEYEKQRRKEEARVIRRPPTDIMNAANLVYADSDGSLFKGNKSTLRTLLSHPNIDSTRTFCNNVHEIRAVLGIEAARSFMIKEFTDVITYEGHYINPRHITLLMDFMVSLGRVSGITFSGIARQPIGALEKASFQNAMGTFAEAAAFGEVKDIKGTSASIYVGKRAQIGTEFSDKFMDKTKFKWIEDEIEDNPNMELDVDAFQDAVTGLTNIIAGDDFMVMEGAEEEMFAGDGPLFLPTEIGDGTGLGMFGQIKPDLLRAPELDIAATKLNEAPCLVPLGGATVKIEDMPTPAQVQTLPTTEPVPALGLPIALTAAIKPFTTATGPTTELPEAIPATLPAPFPSPQPAPQPATQPATQKTVVTFDLGAFLQ